MIANSTIAKRVIGSPQSDRFAYIPNRFTGPVSLLLAVPVHHPVAMGAALVRHAVERSLDIQQRGEDRLRSVLAVGAGAEAVERALVPGGARRRRRRQRKDRAVAERSAGQSGAVERGPPLVLDQRQPAIDGRGIAVLGAERIERLVRERRRIVGIGGAAAMQAARARRAVERARLVGDDAALRAH